MDREGNAYVTGTTYSPDFPLANPFQPTHLSQDAFVLSQDAFVTKLNPQGSGLVYSTFLGGSSGETGYGIAVDRREGECLVVGTTNSLNFPVAKATQSTYGGGSTNNSKGDTFVTKFSPSGTSLVYSTYLGGNNVENGFGIAVDRNGNAYVTGQTNSPNFPTVKAIQPQLGGAVGADSDAFVAKITMPMVASLNQVDKK